LIRHRGLSFLGERLSVAEEILEMFNYKSSQCVTVDPGDKPIPN